MTDRFINNQPGADYDSIYRDLSAKELRETFSLAKIK
jgi:hypothetical protein